MADPKLERTPLGEEHIPVPVRRLFAAGTPSATRLRVARGGAPLGPKDLVAVLYQLTLDDDGHVVEAARKTAGELPDDILLKVLADKIDPRILDLLAELCAARSAAIEAILINWATDDATVFRIARRAGEKELEIVAANETRLVRCPALIEALYMNPKTRMSTVDRVMEMAVRRGLRLDGIPAFEEAQAALGMGAGETETDAGRPEVDAAPPTLEAGEEWDTTFEQMLRMDEPEGPVEMDADPADSARKERQQRIQSLSATAKIRLATLGTQFHRLILVQDSNRVVAMAAIKSPAITDMEVQRIASSRTVADDVIRYIARNKDWLKNYGVKKQLANNPKCPLTVSVRLLAHLHPGDLRAIAKSRNIPAALRSAATHLQDQRRR